MTFEWPIALLALALVPLLVGLLWLSRRRDSRYAIRFSNVGVLAQVVESTRSPWRFVPPVLLLGALAALAVGMARPQVPVTAERPAGPAIDAAGVSRVEIRRRDEIKPDEPAVASSDPEAVRAFVRPLRPWPRV